MAVVVENRDRTILTERRELKPIIHPLAWEVFHQDGYYRSILGSFDLTQQQVVLGVIQELAIVRLTGRTSKEWTRIQGEDEVFVDPLLKRYETRFRRFGIQDPLNTVQMANTAAGTVIEAYRNDPYIDRLPTPISNSRLIARLRRPAS